MTQTAAAISPEHDIILLLTKHALDEDEVRRLKALMNRHMNWTQVFGSLQIHRVVGMAWRNLNRYYLIQGDEPCHFGTQLYAFLANLYKIQAAKGRDQLAHTLRVCGELDRHEVPYTVLKGIVLSHEVYASMGIRDFSDNDILVHTDHIKRATEVVKGLGYVQGDVNFRTNEIVPVGRLDLVTRSMHSHEVYPLIKPIENEFLPFHVVDLQFSIEVLSTNRTNDLVERMHARRIRIPIGDATVSTLQWEDMLLFLCLHFYKEATSINKAIEYDDLLLYKLTDLAHLVNHARISLSGRSFIELTEREGYETEVYYAMTFVRTLYGNNPFIEEVLSGIRPASTSLNDVYNYNSREIVHTWTDSLVERVFNMNRPAEIQAHA